ncbi:hypothetical protein [Aurantimonas sp. VKM B-3413]|uniref:hypothetical protein n=1 Tax=Aurantimonas sp. VKM B-3413 TaxID=2779401 RepID=UPI001E383C97|nr:hypothetical protein [Aurantimonas sp. VKM B-3413]MCB8839135.1 hypothetical protein [Aurantimonas sp. VKM B-3413]
MHYIANSLIQDQAILEEGTEFRRQTIGTECSNRLEFNMLRSLVIAAAVLSLAVPAGTAEPLLIRVVTMAGATGPAYYSAVEQGYRFIGGSMATAGAVEAGSVEMSALDETPEKGEGLSVATAQR